MVKPAVSQMENVKDALGTFTLHSGILRTDLLPNSKDLQASPLLGGSSRSHKLGGSTSIEVFVISKPTY